jgi:hypothetical protein
MSNQVNGLMEAYAAVYDQDLREQLEEEREVEVVGLQIIENAAQVLFSQGYDVNDLIDYFEEASVDTITEDFVSFSEGQVYISESFIVSDEYVTEQFNFLNQLLEATVTQSPTNPKTNPKVTVNNTTQSWQGPARPPANAANAAKPGFFQRAGDWAKGLMGKVGNFAKKIPGAGVVTKIAKSPVGRLAGKIGSRVLPGVGAVAYGADAINRFKKGDWGGGLLSTAGAVTSVIPGAGLIAGLAPAAIQAGTDALGWTGDRSKKGAPPKSQVDKSKWNASKALGGKAAYAAGGGKEKMRQNPGMSAADVQKQGLINLKNKKSSTPAAPAPAAPAPAAPAPAAPAPAAPAPAGQNTKPADQTPTQGPQTTPDQDKNLATQAANDVKAQQERERKKAEAQQQSAQSNQSKSSSPSLQDKIRANRGLPVLQNSYQCDAFDLVLEYLTSEGHVDTLDEALYVMMEMDSKTIKDICKIYQLDELYKGKHGQSEKEYQDSRSPGGQMISGNSQLSGAAVTSRLYRNTGPNPAGGSQRPQGQGRMTSGQRTEMQFRKTELKKKKKK